MTSAVVNENAISRKLTISELKCLSPKRAREEFRRNSDILKRTSGLCSGYMQMNIVCLPKAYADDFEMLCHSNVAPFPLVYRSQSGEIAAPCLAKDFDIRTDLGSYGVFEKDHFLGNQHDLLNFPPWDNMVTFYYGCSFSLEGIANDAGVPFQFLAEGKDSPILNTLIPLVPCGVFKDANMVVSMRPCKKSLIEKLVQAVAPCEVVHGAPIHIGDPSIIGINDLADRFFGSLLEVKSDEIPVFWACGVSARQPLQNAGIDGYWVTHYEESCNYLMVTDVKVNDHLASCKPSFGDDQPKVVNLFEKPDFMSLLSATTLQKITRLENTTHDGGSNNISIGEKGSLARAALILSHSQIVAIETTTALNNSQCDHDDASYLAKILLALGKNVIMFVKDVGMLPKVQEEFQIAFDKELYSDQLEIRHFDQVAITTKPHDWKPVNEASWPLFKIIVSQNKVSWPSIEHLANSSSVKGTALDLTSWGYNITSTAIEYLQTCVIHARYRCHGVGNWAAESAKT